MSLFMFALSCPRQREKEKKNTREKKRSNLPPTIYFSKGVNMCYRGKRFRLKTVRAVMKHPLQADYRAFDEISRRNDNAASLDDTLVSMFKMKAKYIKLPSRRF